MSDINYSPILSDFLKETLRIERLREKKKEGGKITITDQRDIRNNDDKKVDVLKNHLFPSMANLIYFFEFLNKNPEIINRFGEDIEDLLGLKFYGHHVKYARLAAFRRLIDAMLGLGNKAGKEALTDPRFNYQRRLLAIMQAAIHRMAWGYFTVSDYVSLRKKAHTDLTSVEEWIESIIDRPTLHEKKKPRRVLGF